MIMDVENNDVVGVGSFHYVGDEPHLWNRQQRLLAMLKEKNFVKGGCGDDGEGQSDNDDGNDKDDYDFDDEPHLW